ncbi:MAG: PAS domain-containing protein [Bacteroidota bacterium]
MRYWVNQLLMMGVPKDIGLMERLARKIFNLDLLMALILPLLFAGFYFWIGIRDTYIFLLIGFIFLHYLLEATLTYFGGFRISVYLTIIFNVFLISFVTISLHIPAIAFMLFPVGMSVFIYFPGAFRITVPVYLGHAILALGYFVVLSSWLPYESWKFISPQETPLVFGSIVAIAILGVYKILMLVYLYSSVLRFSRRQEQKMNQILGENQLGIVLLDQNWIFRSLNSAFVKLLGYTRSELLNSSIQEFLEDPIENHLMPLIERKVHSMEIFLPMIRKNGKRIVVRAFLQGYYEDKGLLQSVVISAFDTTEECLDKRSKELNSKMINDMLQGLPCIYYRFNKNLEFLESRGPALQNLGLKYNQVVGQRIDVLYHVYPDIVKAHHDVLEKGFSSVRTSVEFEGQQVYFDTKISYYPEQQEGVGLAIDITEQVLAEKALAISQRKYLDVFETTDHAILVADPEEMKVIDCNQAAVEIFHCKSREEFIGSSSGQFTAPVQPDGERYEDLGARVLQTVYEQGIFHERLLGRRMNGDFFWKEIKVIQDKVADAKYFIFFIKDIDAEIKETAKQYKKDQKYQALFEKNQDGLLILDLRLRQAIEANPKAAELFGLEIEELLQRNPIELMPEFQSDGAPSESTFRQKMFLKQAQRHIRYNWDFLHKSGEIFHVEILGFMLPAPDDHLMVYCMRDRTEQRKQQALIQENLSSLQTLNQELKKYIASNLHLENYAHIVAHDLTGPIRSIHTFSELLQRELEDCSCGRRKDYLDWIIQSAEEMEQQVEKLLALAKIDQQGVYKETIKTKDFFARLINDYQASNGSTKIHLNIDSLPGQIRVDATFFRILWNNLIGNALKFQKPNQPNQILLGGTQEEGNLQFYIEDHGMGIRPEDLNQNFNLFYRGASQNRIGGHGIGLAICQKIVKEHGGEIRVSSQEGKGTRFSFHIPE